MSNTPLSQITTAATSLTPPAQPLPPWLQLVLTGELITRTPLRIGGDVIGGGAPALDQNGLPTIPAWTFRGALRSYVEAAMRSMNAEMQPIIHHLNVTGANGKPMSAIRRVLLCCDSVDKNPADEHYQGCLTPAIVARWQADPLVRPDLDRLLRVCTCPVCALFGAPWLAGRVQIEDLHLVESSWDGQYVRVMRKKLRALPPGVRFTFRIVVERATFAEQGLVLLGLHGFETEHISLGAGRAQGFGMTQLEIDWWNCHYWDAAGLLASLSGDWSAPFTEIDAEVRFQALAAWLDSLCASVIKRGES
jgi:CRISPR/Cas system CSM-associated protein Csm3 (group 7 of RAMP superfamily)